jgi:sporulation related protein
MADRYQDRPFAADDDYDRGGDQPVAGRAESDPLAELARLIGQTDPFGSMGRANQQVPPRTTARDPYQRTAVPDDGPAAGPPPWMQRASRHEVPQEDLQEDLPPAYPSAVHPLQRLAAARAAPDPDYLQEPQYADEPDPSRYDDALYGQTDAGAPSQPDPAYAEDDAYAYQDGYDEGADDQVQKRRGGIVTVAVVLALAVVGTGAAFAYRTYVGSPRSGEPPIIRADSSPTKIVPAPSDGSAKLPDRMSASDGSEKIVPREEAPVDVNSKAGPRVVFPPLNANGSPPSAASVGPGNPLPPSGGNGTMPNSEPRKIKTLTVHGDQADGAAVPVTSAQTPPAKPAPTARTASAAAPRNPPAAANASANAPLSLSPQGGSQPAPVAAEPRTRVATTTTPTQIAPAGEASSGGYLVQVSSQKSEADAQASYRALQGKYPGVLGSQSSLVKRVDLGEKGVYYRAFAGPFSSADQAAQVCSSLKAAGGPQCLIQRN